MKYAGIKTTTKLIKTQILHIILGVYRGCCVTKVALNQNLLLNL